jgi:hypothetical protein
MTMSKKPPKKRDSRSRTSHETRGNRPMAASKTPMTVKGVKVERTERALAARAGDGAETAAVKQIRLGVAVDNPGDQPLHVWASWRRYEYDAATRRLTVYLTEQTPPPPPGITMISQHPRTPAQVVVAPRSSATVNVTVPATIRRRVPGTGLGLHFEEEPIGPIDHVELHVQSATEPIEPAKPDESPERHRERLRQTGGVVQTTITITEQKEQ